MSNIKNIHVNYVGFDGVKIETNAFDSILNIYLI
jgi:hypothetical protein